MRARATRWTAVLLVVPALSVPTTGRAAKPASAASTKKDPAETCAEASERGQLLKIEGKLKDARTALLACVREECPAVVKKDCAQFLVEVEAATPTIVVAAKDETGDDLTEVRVLVNGAPFLDRLVAKAIPIDPGVYKFRFEAPGMHPVDRTVVVREGERNRFVDVTLLRVAPPPSKRGPPIAAFVVGGIGVAALGSFAAFGLSARSDYADLRDSCEPRCPSSEVDRVRTKALVADVSLGVAVIGLGLSTWLFVDHARGPKVDVRAGRGGAFVGITASF